MARDKLTGSRIRERRLARGLKQSDLAAQSGISGPYLNLIEHNRRRIGGALLNRIAAALAVEPALLAEGAGAALVTALQEAAAARPGVPAETTRAEEFAGRFPGWAELLTDTAQHAQTLQHSVEAMADRLNHDPQLAASLHEVLSTVTAIRSTASILADTAEIEPEWRDRFHRNLNEDATRLAQSSQALVAYLDAAGDEPSPGVGQGLSPEEEVEQFHAEHGHHYPTLEQDGADEADIERLLLRDLSPQARFVLARDLGHYLNAARQLPMARLLDLRAEGLRDPLALAQASAVSVTTVLRRMAAVPADAAEGAFGLVIVDAAGAFLYRKPLDDFPIPRFGAGCAHWPLYQAFSQPLAITHARMTLAGRERGPYDCFAAIESAGVSRVGRTPGLISVMLIQPVEAAAIRPDSVPEIVGISCRICPVTDCALRRAPAIQSEGF